MTLPFYIVDAFTHTRFKGNPAGVVMLDAFLDDAAMQLIATQAYLPETAFVVQKSPLEFDLRWFTPTVEVNLCGHATLAATHIMRQTGQIKIGDTVTYHTLSGDLRARALETTVELDFPLLTGEPAKAPAALKALGVDILACERNRDNYLVEVKDFMTLITCRPHFKKLAKMDRQGVIVTTARDVTDFDFASRYFAPNCGIDEDLVTGSAHCFLAPYWAKKLGKPSFRALQASKGEGVLDVRLEGDRVFIAGGAITTLKGHLPVPHIKNSRKKDFAA
jgi:PhzF family phenazine biosynthesis protein